MFGFPPPDFMPCQQCGASVASGTDHQHECDPDRKLSYELVQLKRFERFEAELRRWLSTPPGRFASFWAEYDRRRLA